MNVSPVWPAAAPVPYPGPLVGRERELAALRGLAGPAAGRLVTFTGMGGVGKSRLAVEFASEALAAYEGRVAVVALDRVSDATLLPIAIAEALDLGAVDSARLMDRLAEELDAAPTLLVLENLEHLVAGAGLVRRLLDRVPGLTILVTSRREVGVEGERAVVIEPLSVPPPDAPGDPASLEAYPAVALLLADIRRDRPDFALTVHNGPAIAEICRRLEGLPLALELAAGALRLVSPHQLLDHLEERLGRPGRPDRSVPGRQRSLEAAMAWSYEALTPDQQVLYRRLGAFAGAFSVRSVEAVLDASARRGAAPLARTLAEALGALLEVNLLRRVPPGPDGERFAMPATVRLDARRRLDGSPEREPVRWAHAYHFLELAEGAAAELATDAAAGALDRLEAAHDDLRTALDWSTTRGRPGFTLRLAAALAEFWRARGHHTEGRLRLFAALQRSQDAPPLDRCRALIGEGALASLQGEYPRAGELLAAALEIARAEDDAANEATALNWLGTNAFGEGRLELAATRCGEALAIRRRLGDQAGVAASLNNLGGIAHFGGDLGRARALYEESLAIRSSLGDRNVLALTLAHIGLVDRDRREPASAAERFDEAAAIWQRSGDRQRLAVVRHDRALLALDLGDTETAIASFREVVDDARGLGDRALTANALADLARAEAIAGRAVEARADAAEAVRTAVRASAGPVIPLALEAAGVAAAGGDDGLAVRLWGVAARVRRESGFALMPADRALLDTAMAPVLARMGPDAWARATADGEELELAAAVEAIGSASTGSASTGGAAGAEAGIAG